MRKLLAHVLVALLLMPSLVCAMPVCPNTEQISQPSEKPHCADKVNDIAIEPSDTVMLFVDCMGVDLQQSPQPFQVAESTFSPDFSDYPSIEFWSELGAEHLRFHAIRGSPATHHATPHQAPIYFATQRFRL